jgi:predicted anti-sigma-YlaC factor YlaD
VDLLCHRRRTIHRCWPTSRIEALMRRALALDERYDDGAIHEFFVAFEGGRPEAMGGSVERARHHMERAMALSAGKKISPLATFAETVSVRLQDRKGFLELLDRALAFDARSAAPEHRMGNLVSQRRARWLKGRVDELFID